MKTYQAKEGEVTRGWWVMDVAGLPLGRAAARIATVLRGKHKPEFTPHVDAGDFVVVINAEKVMLTGNKWSQKRYYRYTGYLGGLRETTAEKLRQAHPERLIHFAVKGMLPKNRLGRALQHKLKVYANADHPHQAQQPKPLEI